jgi:hypothetical protein
MTLLGTELTYFRLVAQRSASTEPSQQPYINRLLVADHQMKYVIFSELWCSLLQIICTKSDHGQSRVHVTYLNITFWTQHPLAAAAMCAGHMRFASSAVWPLLYTDVYHSVNQVADPCLFLSQPENNSVRLAGSHSFLMRHTLYLNLKDAVWPVDSLSIRLLDRYVICLSCPSR